LVAYGVSVLTLNIQHSNFIIGVGLWLLVILLTGFGAALMGSSAGEIAGALSSVVAAVIGGGFVLAAALIAWKSVQMQIGAQERVEARKQEVASLMECTWT
jgi:hypothetical protein